MRTNKLSAESQTKVKLLEQRIVRGSCPTCEQALPPPDSTTQDRLDEAKSEVVRLEEASGGGKLELQLERQLVALVDNESIAQYSALHRRLQRQKMLEYDLKRSVETIKDRLKGHNLSDIRILAEEAHQLESAIEELRKAKSDCDVRLEQFYR